MLSIDVPVWSISLNSTIKTYYHTSSSRTNKVVSSNPVHGDVYSIQKYVIKFDNDLLTATI